MGATPTAPWCQGLLGLPLADPEDTDLGALPSYRPFPGSDAPWTAPGRVESAPRVGAG